MIIHFPIVKKIAYLFFLAYCVIWFRVVEWEKIIQLSQGSGKNVIRFNDRRIYFDYLHLPSPETCKFAPFLVAVVLSAPEDWEIRDAIRSNWASGNYSDKIGEGDVEVVFILSQPTKSDKEMVRVEAERFGDLIVTNLAETYDNLLYKVYALFHWQHHHCPSAKYLLKVDQDVIVNFDRLISFLPGIPPQFPQMYCKTWVRSMPKRDSNSKWFVAGSQWKRKFFPVYCDGPAYVLSTNGVGSLLEAISMFPPIFIEDVFYTGIVAERLRIRRNAMNKVFHHTRRDLERGIASCNLAGIPLIAAVHPVKGVQKIIEDSITMKKLKCRNGLSAVLKRYLPDRPIYPPPIDLPIFDRKLKKINSRLIAQQHDLTKKP
ncbi:unnamed protein product, partial [Mesorhabditis belari]|uniref:Hexosyltransferase n=1 Tax=Mesorhabditis belari TaxID=2138241 RepID=A0AAF3EW10_9BILA